MNWLHFLLWVGGFYLLYYIVVILVDLTISGRNQKADPAAHELTFTETVAPVRLSPDIPGKPETKGETNMTANISADPEMIASGGVSLNNLFNLAKQEAIIYTRSVSF
ncbi:MAG: hypothetical protein JST19_10780 [Bacteroidetes bacterium]|nr:hypothetical protein [Bacteroidota bacterium]